MPVILDSREPQNVQELFKEFYPKGIIRMEEAGDLNCHERSVGIERKVNNDYVGSVLGTSDEPGRLWAQCERMEETFQHNYLIIIGSYEDLSNEDKGRFTKQSWIGSQISLMARHNIKIIHVKTNREFFQVSKKIFEKSDGVRKVRNSLKKASKNDNPVLMGSLFQVPKIGTHHSKAIIESLNIKSVCQLCRLSKEELLFAEGIGEVKATEIKKHFQCEKAKEGG